MMTPTDLQVIRAAMTRLKPAKVVALDGDHVVREIPVPPGRKRWAAVIAVLARVECSRVELRDRKDGVLEIVDTDGVEATADDVQIQTAPPAAGGSVEGVVALVLRAQQIALANREKETQIALAACTGAVKMLTEAVGSLAQVQRMQLDTQAQAYQMAIKSAQDAAAEAGEAAEGGGLVSEKLLAQLAPIIMAKLMAPTPPAPNGVKS